MIYCSTCGTANRDGSRFCNECGTKLPTTTSSLCPMCGTANPPNSLFCEKCGARLVASLADETEEPEAPAPSVPLRKGLSLPTKPATEDSSAKPAQPPPEPAPSAAAPEETLDWMNVLQSASAEPPGPEPAAPPSPITSQPPAEEIPTWLSGLGIVDQTETPPPEEEKLPEWAQRLRTVPASPLPSATEEEVPDWLKSLGTTGELPTSAEAPSEVEAAPSAASSAPPAREEEPPDWLKGVSVPTEPVKAASVKAPEFKAEAAPPPAPPPPRPVPQEELPDWLRDLRPATMPESDLPDWLNELAAEAAEEIAQRAEAETPEEPATDSALEWVSRLADTGPLHPPPSEQLSAPEEEVPSWLGGPSAAAGAGPTETVTPSAPEEATDWLSALRGATPEVPEEAAAEATEEAAPDWLADLGRVAAGEMASAVTPETPGAQPTEEEAPPDWLAAVSEAPLPVEQTPPEEQPDWLSTLRGAAPEIEETQPSEQPPAEEQVDWLTALRGTVALSEPFETQATVEGVPERPAEPGPFAESTGQPVTPEIPEETPQEAVLPDWLSGIGAPIEAPEPPIEETSASADWLSTLRAAAPEVESQPAETAEPEWLRETEAGEAAFAEPSAEVPDWLRDYGAAAPTPTVPTEPFAAQPIEEGVPEWLKDLGAVAGEAAVAHGPTEAAPPAEEEVPDWLRDLGGQPPAPSAPVEAGVPEWLGKAEQPAAPEPLAEVPDWLRETAAQPVREAAPSPTEEVPAPAQETPDWLRELAPMAVGAATPAAPTAPEKPAEEAPEEVEAPKEAPKESRDWIKTAAPAAAAGLAARKEKEEAAATAPAEVPEWLQQLRQEQAAAPVQPALPQAEIPAWLEALRPTEVEEAGEAPPEVEAEKEGPLAGLANVLPAAPLMGQVQGHAVNLRYEVSADDQARAGVLKELMARPTSAPRKTEAYAVKSSPWRRRVQRWFVTFLLVASILMIPKFDWNAWVFRPLLGTDLLPNLQTLEVPSATQLAVKEIGALPPGAAVLVAFDYDASQSDEMNRIAEVFFRHLLVRGAHIETVSLNPQGSGIAQSVWGKVSGGLAPQLFENSGFVPGQAAGVRSVLDTANPRIVIELASSPDTVRWWAEQLALSSQPTTLIVGASAGAQTLTLPYVKSGQVHSWIVGAAGALAYAKQAQLPPGKDDQFELEALTVVSWLMAIFVGLALIVALVSGPGRRSAK